MPENAYQAAIAVVTEKFASSRSLTNTAIGDLASLIAELKDYAQELQPIDTDIEPPSLDLDINVGEFVSEKPVKPDTSSNFPTNIPEQVPYQNVDFDDVVEPTLGSLQIPVISIAPGDSSYTSNLLTTLQRRLQSIIENGGRALPVEAESEWFNREFERSQQAHLDSLDRASAEWAKRGLPIPDDFLGDRLTTLEVDFKNKRLDVSREIALKQYELADQNTRFAIERGVQLEDILTRLFSQIQDRLMQASKAYVDAQVAFYNAQLQKYQVEALIFKAILEGRITRAKAVVDLYVANVTAYRSTVEAEATRLDAIIRAYLGEVEAYKGEAMVFTSLSGLQIQVFEAQVKHMVAQTELLIKNAEIELKNFEVISGLKVEGLRAIAQTLAQQIAGAWAAVSASASISGSGGSSTQTSYNYNFEE